MGSTFLERNPQTLLPAAVIGARHTVLPWTSSACDLAARFVHYHRASFEALIVSPHAGVLCFSMDVGYPKENSRLADQILNAGGILISEFPSGDLPP